MAQLRRAAEPTYLVSTDRQPEHARQQKAVEYSVMATEEHQDDDVSEEDTERRRPSRRDEEPLDIKKLKAIAALARQIQGYPRHG